MDMSIVMIVRMNVLMRTVVKTDKPCCSDSSIAVMQAVKSSRFPVSVQVSSIFIDAEDLSEDGE